MSDIVNTLRELNVSEDAIVTLSYSEGADVWHINESHVQESVGETSTANMLAGLLASPVPVYSGYGEVSEGNEVCHTTLRYVSDCASSSKSIQFILSYL